MTLIHRVIQSPFCGDRDQLIMASVSYRSTKMATEINYVWYNLLDWAEEKTWSCKIFRPLGFDYGTKNIRHSTTTESIDSTVLRMIHKLAVTLYAGIQEALLSNRGRKPSILADFRDYWS